MLGGACTKLPGRRDVGWSATGHSVQYGERLAAWLVALSIWTEWHATHHPAADPCA